MNWLDGGWLPKSKTKRLMTFTYPTAHMLIPIQKAFGIHPFWICLSHLTAMKYVMRGYHNESQNQAHSGNAQYAYKRGSHHHLMSESRGQILWDKKFAALRLIIDKYAWRHMLQSFSLCRQSHQILIQLNNNIDFHSLGILNNEPRIVPFDFEKDVLICLILTNPKVADSF